MALTEKTKAWIKKNADVDLTGKTVLITGANSSIGFKTVETMANLPCGAFIPDCGGHKSGFCNSIWQKGVSET